MRFIVSVISTVTLFVTVNLLIARFQNTWPTLIFYSHVIFEVWSGPDILK